VAHNYHNLIYKLLISGSEIFNDCDQPSPPSNGYIHSYNLIEGGLTVTFVCQSNTSLMKGLPGSPKVLYTVTAVCSLDGNWDPQLDEFCSMINQSKNNIKCPSLISRLPNRDKDLRCMCLGLRLANVLLFYN
jgi:hypothetical protein